MKTKNENKKFTLEKFEVAKLKDIRNIIGGTGVGGDDNGGGGDTNTDQDKADKQSGFLCKVIGTK